MPLERVIKEKVRLIRQSHQSDRVLPLCIGDVLADGLRTTGAIVQLHLPNAYITINYWYGSPSHNYWIKTLKCFTLDKVVSPTHLNVVCFLVIKRQNGYY